ncbi:type IV secretion system DNA-binding domain-containing protein [Acidiferrobacter thiooxydans]|uniref:type IV secretion system DNA-binding domain-containing protein n=1 Tax=Acidiferrobacter thiooxydans TaxID=163359 RepID=UPI00082674DE|nr:type IV secretion system DNA-binding domain-containing protein [Acidiferrobacter thiooxydans]UEO00466.1 type IV secretion system DNA-binding domain-containing protein [Acidiferrobacter thiooxydans]
MSNKVLTTTIALGASAAGAYALTHNFLAPAVAAAAVGLVLHAKYSGGTPQEKQFGDTVRGTQVDSKTKRRGRSPDDQTSIGGIAIPRDSEAQHLLLVGSPGTGKTVVCEAVMDVIRARKQRAVVYDSTGEFVSHYYRPGQDVILSPVDSRSALWSPWAEGRDSFAYENLAQALIPDGQGENHFWAQAARAILRAALSATTDLAGLIDLIFAQDQEVLLMALQAQGLAGLAGPPQMLASSRGECATYVQPLSYLPAPGPSPFSIRDWVKDESKDSWLFITSRADVHKSIRPLISMWIGLAVQAAMSLPPNRQRRTWFVLDEMPTLQKLPSLDVMLAGGRKYGIAALLGVQTIAQMRDTYGRDAAAAVLSHPSTRLTLRVGDSETATYLSDSLGQRHTIRKVTSESQNSGGGGQSTSEQHSIEAAVLPSEILALPNLVGYLRVPNDPVIKKIALTPRDRPTLAEPYQDRALSSPPPIPQALAPAPADLAGLTRNPASPALDVPDLDGPDLPGL